MRILYLHQYFNTPDMAGGTRSYEMGRRLAAAGHEVHMVTSDRRDVAVGGHVWRETDEDGIHVHWTMVPYANAMSYAQRMKAFLTFAWRAGAKAAAVGGDLVFATSTPLMIALPGVYAARRLGVPMVLEVRDLWPEIPIAIGALDNPVLRAAARWLERFAYRNASHVVALSPDMKEGVEQGGVPAEHVTVIPNGCDLQLFDAGPERGRLVRDRLSWLGERPFVVYVGALGRLNGVEYLARLAAAVWEIDPEVRFAVIGEGGEELMIRGVASQLGVLDRNLFMMGSIPKREVPDWLSAADVVMSLIIDVEPAWKSTSSNKFFDALAAGTPIASNHGGWQSELAGSVGAGLRLNRHDMADAGRTLVAALRDGDWLAGAGAAARRLGGERFDRDVLGLELTQTLERVAGGGGRDCR